MCHAAGVSRAVNGLNSDCVILIKVTKKTIVLIEVTKKTIVSLEVTKRPQFVKSYQKTIVSSKVTKNISLVQ